MLLKNCHDLTSPDSHLQHCSLATPVFSSASRTTPHHRLQSQSPTLPPPPNNKPGAGSDQCPNRAFPAVSVLLPYRGRRVVRPSRPSSPLHSSDAALSQPCTPQLLLLPLSGQGSNTTRWRQGNPGSYLQDSCLLCAQVRLGVSASSILRRGDTLGNSRTLRLKLIPIFM